MRQPQGCIGGARASRRLICPPPPSPQMLGFGRVNKGTLSFQNGDAVRRLAALLNGQKIKLAGGTLPALPGRPLQHRRCYGKSLKLFVISAFCAEGATRTPDVTTLDGKLWKQRLVPRLPRAMRAHVEAAPLLKSEHEHLVL